MKNTLKKIGLIVLALAMTASSAAVYAEEVPSDPVTATPAPVVVETKEESTPAPVTSAPDVTAASVEDTAAPAAENTNTAPAEQSTEAPATEAPATEAPATEAPATEAPATEAPATEAPATEAPATEAPATEAPATEETVTPAPEATPETSEQPTTEPTAEPTEEPTVAPTEEAPVPFTGTVEIKLENKGEIFYGDTVELRAVIRNANTAYKIRWEVKKTGEWEIIPGEDEETYEFTVTEENAAWEYRVVLITEA